jgi:glycosyltransferase involved in cell wall biosynthesis
MKISVITISYNDCKGLQDTITSVISQTCFENIEYIVIDGGSTDGSKKLIDSLKEKFKYSCSEKDGGIYQAMNKGLSHASGDYVIFANAGDKFYDKKVIENFLSTPRVKDMYVGDTLIIYPNGKTQLWKSPKEASMRILYDGALSHQATFFRTEILKKYGFDEKLRIVSDWKVYIQLLINENCSYEKLSFMVTRFSWGGISSQADKANLERKKVLDEYFPPRIQDDFKYLHFGYTDLERKFKRIKLKTRSGHILTWMINLIYKIQYGK